MCKKATKYCKNNDITCPVSFQKAETVPVNATLVIEFI